MVLLSKKAKQVILNLLAVVGILLGLIGIGLLIYKITFHLRHGRIYPEKA